MPPPPSHRSQLWSLARSFYKTVWDYNEASSWVFGELVEKKNSSMNREVSVTAKSESHQKQQKNWVQGFED